MSLEATAPADIDSLSGVALLKHLIRKVLASAYAPLEAAVIAEKVTKEVYDLRLARHRFAGSLLQCNSKSLRDEVPTQTVSGHLPRMEGITETGRTRRGNRRLWASQENVEKWEELRRKENAPYLAARDTAKERIKLIDNSEDEMIHSITVLLDDRLMAYFDTDLLGQRDAQKIAQRIYNDWVAEAAQILVRRAEEQE